MWASPSKIPINTSLTSSGSVIKALSDEDKRVIPLVERAENNTELEIKKTIIGQKGDVIYYETLALRAASALLSPFGLSEEELVSRGSVQTTLDMWSGKIKS